MTFLWLFSLCAAQNLSCAEGDRCNKLYVDGAECQCDEFCYRRGDCCSDFPYVCHGACRPNVKPLMLCRDGSECDPLTHPESWGCCLDNGGKLGCPSTYPFMCSGIDAGADNSIYPVARVNCGHDHCCLDGPICTDEQINRSILQDCPVPMDNSAKLPISVSAPICPFYYGQLQPQSAFFLGSIDSRTPLNTMEIDMNGIIFTPPWKYCPYHEENALLCQNGETCDMSNPSCCSSRGERSKCPYDLPVMCKARNCNDDYCCARSEDDCSDGPLEAENCPVTTVTESSTSTTEIPSNTTEIPSSTTEIPSSTTEIPSNTTEIPSNTTEIPSNTTETTTVRQCSAYFPVLCTDGSCVVDKRKCGKTGAAVQTDCPLVPQCAAEGDFDATYVGATAIAFCGIGPKGPRFGRKSRACVSKFEDEVEVAQWGEVDESFCVSGPRCPPSKYKDQNYPYILVGELVEMKKADCPGNVHGVYLLNCVKTKNTGEGEDDGNEVELRVDSWCQMPCDQKYCTSHGNATVLPDRFELCNCTCEAGWSGVHCESQQEMIDQKGGLSSTGLIGIIFAFLGVCLVAVCFKMSSKSKKEKEKANKSERPIAIE